MGEIKVNPEMLRNNSQTIRSSVNSVNMPSITKDETTNVMGNTTAHSYIDQLTDYTNSLKSALSTFCDNLNSMADAMQEVDENV